MYLVFKYSFFATVAGLTNILCQAVINHLYHGQFQVYISMAAGTLAGLSVKYNLDKRHIFYFQTRTVIHDGQKFLLYSVMGLITTCIFWSVELTFTFTFHLLVMRYLGAAIGLIIGYFLKYQLDKRFVFVEYA